VTGDWKTLFSGIVIDVPNGKPKDGASGCTVIEVVVGELPSV
jgi:hypothetical protein